MVPARKGSKGLKNKNIRTLAGRPLILWTIKLAKECSFIDTVVVSTDSKKIGKIALKAGAKFPFLRPKHLSTDKASSVDVVLHCIKYLSGIGEKYKIVILLEPTSPLRKKCDIEKAISILIKNKLAQAVVSVCKSEACHPIFLHKMTKRKRLLPFEITKNRHIRRQEVSELFFPEGSVYASKINFLLRRKTFYHEKTFGIEVPLARSLEIDTYNDLKMADILVKKYHELP